MPTKLIQFSFSGGVFSPSIHGRADLEKYSLGLRDALNYFVDYRGGIVSRAGFQFGDVIPDAANGVLFRKFRFNNRLANTFLLIFTQGKLRFAQDNAWLVHNPHAISSIVGSTVFSTGHTYVNDDLLIIGNQLFYVDSYVPNQFLVKNFDGTPAFPPTGATEAVEIYTRTTPYLGSDLQELVFRQRRNEILITHPDYETKLVTRIDANDWSIQDAPFSDTSINSPGGKVATASGAGAASILWTVTAVGPDGKESTVNGINTLASIVNYTAVAGSVTFDWNIVQDAQYYKVYRSIVFPGAVSAGQELGYIGRTTTNQFVDNNIIPDFTQCPPLKRNPFAPGAIDYINITAGGAGYAGATTVSITDPNGTGFVGQVIRVGGVVVGITVLNPGEGYTAPVVVITGPGAGAAATAVLGTEDGTYPSASIIYNQRLWLMGSTAFPMRLVASRNEGDLLNFNEGFFPTSTDPIILDIDSGELTPIRYGELVNDSIFVFTDQSIWQVNLTDGEYKATLRTENGVGQVAPLLVNRDILFTLSEGTGVWALRPSNLPNYYVDVDLTTFAGHLFKAEDPIIAWGFAREPFRIVWAATKSGKLLSMTYLSEQNVYAWMPHDTRGKVVALEVLREDGVDRLYIGVERENGVFFERQALRNHKTPEEIWSVDAALRTERTFPAADLSIALVSGYQHTCTASASVFVPADVGAHVRAGSGRGEVTAYISPTQVTVEFDMPIKERAPQSTAYPRFDEGTWSLDPLFTTVSGLEHLEGMEVEIFADGSDFGTAVVDGGQITLDQPASYVLVGLGYTGFAETLPLVVTDGIIEDKVKRLVGLSVRLEDTRGLRYGSGATIYPMKERTTEAARAPTEFQNGIRVLSTRADWRMDDPIRFEKVGPGASGILNLIADVEIGDDDN